MKIAVVCDVLGAGNNGTSVAANNLIEAMRKRGHSVNVICCDETRMGCEDYYVLPKRSFGPFDGYVSKMGISLAKPVEYMLRSGIEGADVVHCMLPFKLSINAVRIAEELGIPVTAGFHCQAENFSEHLFMKNFALLNNYVYRRYYNKVFSHAACVHYPSQFIRDVFENATDKTNGRVISNGVGDDFRCEPVAKPNALKGKFVILSTGRYSREKCHDVLIRAVGRSAHNSEIALIIAGQGPLEEHYRELAEREGVCDMRLGFIPRKDMPELVNCCDLYVHPAEAELEGIACLEAIRCGRPIVVSDSAKSATRTFVMDERGLFRNGKANSLADSIDYWIEHPEERGKAGRFYAESGIARRKEECMDDMERMFADVAGRKIVETANERSCQLLYR